MFAKKDKRESLISKDADSFMHLHIQMHGLIFIRLCPHIINSS